ncbi:MAG: hypothetical protein AAF236_15520, partial [Verrucomicrobiota bacterium]
IKNQRHRYLTEVSPKRWKVTWNRPGDNWVAMRTGTASTFQLVCKVAYATHLTELDRDMSDPDYHYIYGTFTGWAVMRSSNRTFIRQVN